jgi:hypothetical protein
VGVREIEAGAGETSDSAGQLEQQLTMACESAATAPQQYGSTEVTNAVLR